MYSLYILYIYNTILEKSRFINSIDVLFETFGTLKLPQKVL